jgi:hypothetical protein
MTTQADAIIQRRCRQMRSDHRRRAHADHQHDDVPPLDALVQLVKDHPTCAYCGCVLTPETFSIDHQMPTCRRADYSLGNLVVACRFCQERKGLLSAEEFRGLLSRIATWAPRAGSDLLGRLRAGGGARYAKARAARPATLGAATELARAELEVSRARLEKEDKS